MAATIHDTHCCGIKEIDNLGTEETPEAAMRSVCKAMPQNPPPAAEYFYSVEQLAARRTQPATAVERRLAPRYSLLTFSGVVTRRSPDHSSSRPDNYGQAFVDYIAAHNLGDVTAGPVVRNRRSGNDICMWIWRFDLDRLQEWWNAHMPKPAP